MHPSWFLMTSVMPFIFITIVLLIPLQIKSLKWYCAEFNEYDIYSRRTQLFCLYGVYIFGGSCAIQCYLCHISNFFPEWYCIYGMTFCVILYAAAKTCLYGFFFERAKIIKSSVIPRTVKQYIIPIYIGLYFVIYAILCPLSFRGQSEDPLKDSSTPTACLFGKYEPWVFIFSAIVDSFNSIFFLFLFVYPLWSIVRNPALYNESKSRVALRMDIINTLKYNVICSLICMISSVSFLIICIIGDSSTTIGHYLWFGGDIDALINSLCVFIMFGSNRKYFMYLYKTYISPTILNDKSTQKEQISIETKVSDTDKAKPDTVNMWTITSTFTLRSKPIDIEAIINNDDKPTEPISGRSTNATSSVELT
eukprot:171593_1